MCRLLETFSDQTDWMHSRAQHGKVASGLGRVWVVECVREKLRGQRRAP
jgi:hypothetical protein